MLRHVFSLSIPSPRLWLQLTLQLRPTRVLRFLWVGVICSLSCIGFDSMDGSSGVGSVAYGQTPPIVIDDSPPQPAAQPTAKAKAKGSDTANFRTADALVSQGKWQAALALYQGIVAKGQASGRLFAQMAVCEFRLGNKGRSLYYFRRAQELAPRTPQLARNIAFVTPAAKDGGSDVLSQLLPLPLSPGEWQVVALVLLALLVAVVYGLTRKRIPTWLGAIAAVLVVAALGLMWQSRQLQRNFGVVVQDDAAVTSGPHPFDVTLFKLPEGTEVAVEAEAINSHGRWWQITLSDGKAGWIAESNLLTSRSVEPLE